jgi:AMMECR1 domain-containing protein
LQRPTAFVASGDLSHRLTASAPAGYFHDAHLFDEEIVESIKTCEPSRIVRIDQDLRRAAGECGYRSMLVLFGAVQDDALNCEVLHYEAPFGVGYLVAQIMASNSGSDALAENRERLKNMSDASAAQEIIDLARRAVEIFVREERLLDVPSSLPAMLHRPAACFVSIKTNAGDLRGCIGTIEPVHKTLAKEIIANAASAATRDPRFPPVAAAELPLCAIRLTCFLIRHRHFGGTRSEGLRCDCRRRKRFAARALLPDLEGVLTVDQQVSIAARKAGIPPTATLRLFRFRVERFRAD